MKPQKSIVIAVIVRHEDDVRRLARRDAHGIDPNRKHHSRKEAPLGLDKYRSDALRFNSMPFLKRKSVEDLVAGKDMLYSKAGNIAAAGSMVTDSLIQRLVRNKVPVVTVIYLTKEDEAKGLKAGDVEKLVKDKEDTDFSLLRLLLFESAKKLYKPYSELTNKAFWGKLGEKLIKKDFLLERRPDVPL